MLALVIFAFGYGARVSTFSVLSSWVNKEHSARFYGIVAVIENLGVLAGEPTLQNVFAATLDFSGVWRGTPFFCTAVRSPVKLLRVCKADSLSACIQLQQPSLGLFGYRFHTAIKVESTTTFDPLLARARVETGGFRLLAESFGNGYHSIVVPYLGNR